jgi:asparagine synthetase B (glutamine-hydrolysing)
MIKKLLCDVIEKESDDHKEVAVLLSGGADSLSCALAAHVLNKNVYTYTFHLKGNPTYDSEKAYSVSHLMGWKCTVVEVTVDSIEEDFYTLRNEFQCIKKTHYECTFPFLYIYPLIKEKIIISGVAADGHYGVSKKACMHYKTPKTLFDQFREEYFTSNNPAGYQQQLILSKKYNKRFIAPYLDKTIIDFFRQYDWFELNKPFQKHHVISDFGQEFKAIGKPKPHINLQLGAGVDKAFESLLQSTEINFKNRKRMLDVYRDWKLYK